MDETSQPIADRISDESLQRLQVAWQVLGALLVEGIPSQELLDRVRDEELLADWPMLPSELAAAGLENWRSSASTNESRDEIERDYRELFIGPGHLLAPPWESVYTSDERLIFEKSTLEVRAEYRKQGKQAPRLNRDPDDHISLELEFLRDLLAEVLVARQAGDLERADGLLADHQRFVNEHLMAWLPRFCVDIDDNAHTYFVRGLGLLLIDAAQQAEQLTSER